MINQVEKVKYWIVLYYYMEQVMSIRKGDCYESSIIRIFFIKIKVPQRNSITFVRKYIFYGSLTDARAKAQELKKLNNSTHAVSIKELN